MNKLFLRLLLIVLVVVSAPDLRADCWKRQGSGFPRETLHGIVFPTPSDAIAVGDGGLIARSADSGASWTLLNYITEKNLNAVAFANALEGWAGGNEGTLLHTSDGGNTWVKASFPGTINIKSVSFRSTDTGFLAGDNFMYRTWDGGLNWVPYAAIPLNASFTYVKSFGTDTVYAYARGLNDGYLYRSYNNGRSWNWDTVTRYIQIDFATPKVGWSVSHPAINDLYYKTTDAGISWTLQHSVANAAPDYGNLLALDTNTVFVFLNVSNGTGAHYIVYSTNGGNSWTSNYHASMLYNNCIGFSKAGNGAIGDLYGTLYSIKSPTSAITQRTFPDSRHLETIEFADTLNGIAAGATKTFRTTDGGATWVQRGGLAYNSFASSVQMIDSLRAWLVAENGILFKTIDGGSSWSVIINGYCKDAHFYSAKFGMASVGGAVQITRDSGATWSSVMGSLGLTFETITCLDSLHWYVQALDPNLRYLYKSNDAGTTWTLITMTAKNHTQIQVFDTSRMYAAVGLDIVKSVNGGTTFASTYPYIFHPTNWLVKAKMSFYDSLHGMTTSADWTWVNYCHVVIAKTWNGAANWQVMPINTGSTVTCIKYLDSNHAWGCTNWGDIYRYYAVCPPDPAIPPILNRSAHAGCTGDPFSMAISNWSTYSSSDTLKAELKLGATLVASPLINAAGQINFTLPATPGAYTLNIKLTNPANPMGVVRSIPIVVQSPMLTPTIAISAANIACSGTPLNLKSTITNGGPNPRYQWSVNGAPTGSGATFSYIPANGDSIKCVLVSNSTCLIKSTDTSNLIPVVVNPVLTPSASIAASHTNAVCSGTTVTYTASVTNGGNTPVYLWKVNSANVGTGGNAYAYKPANNDTVVCVLTSSVPCPSTTSVPSNQIIAAVIPTVTPANTIVASDTSVCIGTSVTFTATATNGGVAPAYQWTVNGINTGTNSATHSYFPANNDTVRCVMTSSASCPSPASIASGAIIMKVSPYLTPSVSIAATPADTVCSGTLVTFSTTTTAGGSAPSFQWTKNGLPVGLNAPTYSSSTLANGDSIGCVLTSNAACLSVSADTSNSVVMSTNPLPFAVITKVRGMLDAGPAGNTYQWFLNGTPIPGATGSTYAPTQNGSYTVMITDLLGCSATSEPVEVQSVGVGAISSGYDEVTFYPNPAQTLIHINAPKLVNVNIARADGKTLLRLVNTRQIDISALPDGVYVISISDKDHLLLKRGKLLKLSNQ